MQPKAFPAAKKSQTVQGGGKNLKPTGVQHPIGRPTSSSRKHRSASREGGLPDARGRRCRAAQPRASLHRTKIPQAVRLATAPSPPGGGSAGTPRHRADRGTARDEPAGRFRASKRPRTVRSPVRLAKTGRGSLFEASTNTTLVEAKPTAGRAARLRASVSIRAPQSLSAVVHQ